MQCHATGREDVRRRDKHEKRRSGDLPIVAPPIPHRRGDATLTNESSSANSGPLPSAANEACAAVHVRGEISTQTCVDDSNAIHYDAGVALYVSSSSNCAFLILFPGLRIRTTNRLEKFWIPNARTKHCVANFLPCSAACYASGSGSGSGPTRFHYSCGSCLYVNS
jgi:hypothetical protein